MGERNGNRMLFRDSVSFTVFNSRAIKLNKLDDREGFKLVLTGNVSLQQCISN